jgi:hypothetical protein
MVPAPAFPRIPEPAGREIATPPATRKRPKCAQLSSIFLADLVIGCYKHIQSS